MSMTTIGTARVRRLLPPDWREALPLLLILLVWVAAALLFGALVENDTHLSATAAPTHAAQLTPGPDGAQARAL